MNNMGSKSTTRKTKEMSEAARLARNSYHKKWAKENPEKIRAATRRYWEKKAETAKEG